MTYTTHPRYVDVHETARYIRKAVHDNFPNTKFSVRIERFSQGSAVNIRWTDGPTEAAVRNVTDAYNGVSFDGSTDSRVDTDHWVFPDGTTAVHYRSGRWGEEAFHGSEEPPVPGAEVVHFTSWIGHERSYSNDTYTKARAIVEEATGESFDSGKWYEIHIDDRFYRGFSVDIAWQYVAQH